jgi:heptosyltransferase I
LNILIVKLSSLGDVVQTIPVVHDILRQHPDAQIDWVVEEAFAPLLTQVKGVRRVLPIAQRRWRKSRFSAQTRREKNQFDAQLQEQAYDLVIDCQGLIKSAWVMRQARLTAQGERITFANGSDECSYEWPVRWLASRTVPMPQRVHAVQRTRLLAAGALGYAVQGEPVYNVVMHETEVEPAVLFAHGTTRDDNLWPLERWVAVGQRLIAQGLQVWIPQAGAREAQFAKALSAALGAGAVVLPPMGLPALWQTMARTQGVIGVDSGVSHMAVALDLPHVQIFSHDRAWRAGPVGRAHQVSAGGAQAPSADQVWQAWCQVMAAKQ